MMADLPNPDEWKSLEFPVEMYETVDERWRRAEVYGFPDKIVLPAKYFAPLRLWRSSKKYHEY